MHIPPATVLLRPGEADRVVAGHPWVFAKAVLRATHQPSDGATVQVKDHRQRLLGTGLWNGQSKIRVRMVARGRIAIDRAFFEKRIHLAKEQRRRHLPQASSLRVINAESDELSGLIVDQYEEALVVQTTALGMDQRQNDIVAALQSVLAPRSIYERNDAQARLLEGLPTRIGLLSGKRDGQTEARMNGLRFRVNLLGGHKTGLYLDQQVNYQAVATRAPGARVLDCFSYQGGFSLHAARVGATEVLGLEQSADAVTEARKNADLNGLKCTFETANVFDWLKDQTRAYPHKRVIPRFDLIILDPPTFTRTRAAVADALRGYKEIHLRALKLLKPGGLLATFCCSHHIQAETFKAVILEAAFDARKILRQVAVYRQSPDHPIIPIIPETEYLKGFGLEIAG